MRITIADVARLANVSKTTVSAVINRKPGISEETREKVLEIIKKLNYHPNEIARSLSIRKTKSIGLVTKEIDNPYFAKIMKGVFDFCREHSYTVLLGSSELSPIQERKSIETLTNQRVDGLIISPLQGPEVDFSYLIDLIRDQYPLVMLDTVKNITTNVVDIDNIHAAYQAVSYLIELGHTDIVYFAGPSYSAHSDERLQGYQQAHIDHNLPIYKENIIRVGSAIDHSYQIGRQLFSHRSNAPTAVFCYNDLVAIGLVNALIELGIQVPTQISVVGFDNLHVGEYFKIPLTTVHVPAYEIGYKAAELLIQRIQHPETAQTEKIFLPAKLIVRNSCAKKILP